jgi:hypothetical protein
MAAFMTTAMRALGGLDAVDRFLRATDDMSGWPVFTELEYVERTLQFASVQGAECLSELSAVYFELSAAAPLEDDERTDFPDSAGILANLSRAQEGLIEWLEIVQSDPSSATRRLASVITYAFDHMVIRPERVSSADPFEVHSRYYPGNLEAAFGYALHLILKDQHALGRKLCRCKYSACKRFFLEIKPHTGNPRRVYCSEAHFKAARTESRAQWMREHRKKRRAQAAPTMRRGQK